MTLANGRGQRGGGAPNKAPHLSRAGSRGQRGTTTRWPIPRSFRFRSSTGRHARIRSSTRSLPQGSPSRNLRAVPQPRDAELPCRRLFHLHHPHRPKDHAALRLRHCGGPALLRCRRLAGGTRLAEPSDRGYRFHDPAVCLPAGTYAIPTEPSRSRTIPRLRPQGPARSSTMSMTAIGRTYLMMRPTGCGDGSTWPTVPVRSGASYALLNARSRRCMGVSACSSARLLRRS
jgi:hypothetical protein